jgi:glycosyltransferase involved in cell wall biosynthesis
VSPRRVLMTADAVGGVWTYTLELARGLGERGTEVMLAVLGPEPTSDQREAAIAVPGLVLLVPKLELEWQDRAGPLPPEACQRLLGLEEAFRPDIVHCNGFREAAAGFSVPTVVVAHSCVRTWWEACRHEALPPEWSAYTSGVRVGLAAARAVVAPTEAFLADFATAWGRLPRPRVIANGLDLDLPPARHRRPVILTAGRLWDEAKNSAALARIARDLPWPVLMAGEPVADGTNEAVRCLGHLPRHALHEVMAEAAIFVAPARYEPFGLAALEAAKLGCALVLSNLPSFLEVWGDAARFVPPDDTGALRRSLRDLIDDHEALGRLQAAAGARARAFSRQPMVDRYLALYGELLAGNDGRKGRAA